MNIFSRSLGQRDCCHKLKGSPIHITLSRSLEVLGGKDLVELCERAVFLHYSVRNSSLLDGHCFSPFGFTL